MNNIYSKEWNESFKRNENNILYPKEEVVKFLNRFIKKKISYGNNFKQIIELELIKILSKVSILDVELDDKQY